jgi:hypothetical protein
MDATKELEKVDQILWKMWLILYLKTGGTVYEFRSHMIEEQLYPQEAVDGFIKKYGAMHLVLVAERVRATVSAIAKEQVK